MPAEYGKLLLLLLPWLGVAVLHDDGEVLSKLTATQQTSNYLAELS